jgi:hypothetical protein
MYKLKESGDRLQITYRRPIVYSIYTAKMAMLQILIHQVGFTSKMQQSQVLQHTFFAKVVLIVIRVL